MSPGLLRELATTEAGDKEDLLKANLAKTPNKLTWKTVDYEKIVKDESQWRLAFTRSGFGISEGKLVQAICYFSDFQEKLETIVRRYA